VTGRLSVVVLTCSRLGIEVAERLAALPEVGRLTVVTTCAARRRQGALEKACLILRHDGPWRVLRAALERLAGARQDGGLAGEIRRRCPGAAHVHCDDLHAAESRARLETLGADLGVVAGTYLLRPEVFTIPRLGCLNLHLGLAPEFRGSSPGFYELLEGATEVGVTIHRVTRALDGGPILAQQRFPLDPAPAGDPIAYLLRFQRETLVPGGARLMASVVAGLARGAMPERDQGPGRRPRRRATWGQKRELRRVVRERRLTAGPAKP
jgi:hypothetical protein